MLALTSKESGFSIIELIIAIAVIAVVVPSLAAGISNLTATNVRTKNLTAANLLAENKAEELRNQGFNSLADGTFDFSDELPDSLPEPKDASYSITNTEPGIKEIQISITYKDFNKQKTLDYKTIVSELGVGQ